MNPEADRSNSAPEVDPVLVHNPVWPNSEDMDVTAFQRRYATSHEELVDEMRPHLDAPLQPLAERRIVENPGEGVPSHRLSTER